MASAAAGFPLAGTSDVSLHSSLTASTPPNLPPFDSGETTQSDVAKSSSAAANEHDASHPKDESYYGPVPVARDASAAVPAQAGYAQSKTESAPLVVQRLDIPPDYSSAYPYGDSLVHFSPDYKRYVEISAVGKLVKGDIVFENGVGKIELTNGLNVTVSVNAGSVSLRQTVTARGTALQPRNSDADGKPVPVVQAGKIAGYKVTFTVSPNGNSAVVTRTRISSQGSSVEGR